MDWLQVLVLALVQGITEFLPVSSSAHLLLVPILTSWPDQGLAFDVALHVGSLAAVLIYFRHEISTLFLAWVGSFKTRTINDDARLAWGVIVATIPVCIFGYLLKDIVATAMRSPLWLSVGLIVFGVVLSYADYYKRGEKTEHQLTWKGILLIGFAQALALVPGTSRSGITLTAALFLGLSREAAARFSFLLSIPVIVIAGLVETKELIEQEAAVDWGAMTLGMLISGVSAYLCIHYFLAFIRKIGIQPFVVYRIALGLLLLAIYF